LSVTITPKQLNISYAVAAKYLRAARKAGVEFDELVSIGNLALVYHAGRYDPRRSPGHSTNPERAMGGFLHKRVEWAIREAIWPPTDSREHRRRSRESISLDQTHRGQDDGLHALLGRSLDPGASIEAQEEIEYYMGLCTEAEQAVIILCVFMGLDAKEAGQRTGTCRQNINERLRMARKKMRTAQTQSRNQTAPYTSGNAK
jgi:RNA polymerase sigma factor (sigma-70 family)